MISCNGISAIMPSELRKAQKRLRRAGIYGFMMPAIDAAARGNLDFGMVTEPDAIIEFTADLRILAIGATTPNGEMGLRPGAWAVTRYMHTTRPAYVLIDTVGSREAWATIAQHIAALRFAAIILCSRAAAPYWTAELQDIAPVQTVAPVEA